MYILQNTEILLLKYAADYKTKSVAGFARKDFLFTE